MFNVTRKKLVFFVMTTVAVTLMCFFVSIYNIFHTLILDDYSTKISHFTNQDATRLSAHLKFLSSNMDNICNEFDLANEIASSKVPNYITIKIANAVKYSPYISYIYVYQDNRLIQYFPINAQHFKPNDEMNEILNKPAENCENNNWAICKSQNPGNSTNALYYIKNTSDDIRIIFQINSEDIFKILNSDTLFCNETQMFIFSKGKQFFPESKNTTFDIDKNTMKKIMTQKYNSPVCKKGKVIYTHHVPQTKLYICSATKCRYITQKMSLLVFILIAIYTASILLCRFFTIKLGREITDALEKIHNDMEHYYG